MRALVVEYEVKLPEHLRKGINGNHLAIKGEHDLIVLDLILPGIDGFAVLAEVRSKNQMPLRMLTARDKESPPHTPSLAERRIPFPGPQFGGQGPYVTMRGRYRMSCTIDLRVLRVRSSDACVSSGQLSVKDSEGERLLRLC